VDVAYLAKEMAEELVDPALRAWVLPAFSTTTPTDTVVGAILLKAYFNYVLYYIECGIPRVTLESERTDWTDIRERLREYRRETAAWNHLRAFDAPESEENVDFWQRVAHYERGTAGRAIITGGSLRSACSATRANGLARGLRRWAERFSDFLPSLIVIHPPQLLDAPASLLPVPASLSLSVGEFFRTYAVDMRGRGKTHLVLNYQTSSQLDTSISPGLHPGPTCRRQVHILKGKVYIPCNNEVLTCSNRLDANTWNVK
jgi:hypothetical protein